jgi:tetratricopeptide (TPR) repeat protein
MRKFFQWLMAALVFAGFVTAAPADVAAQFDAAGRLYAEGKFPAAADAYDQLIVENGVSTPLLFNLGNAHFKSSKLGLAIASYRRALELSPRDADVIANLQFARARVNGPQMHAGFWERRLRTLSLDEWSWLAAAALWMTLALLTLRQLRPALASSLKSWTFVSAACVVAVVACLLAARNVAQKETAIVVVPEVSVRNSPFDESPGSFTVHDGAELRVLDHKNGWWQVADGTRRIGWLKGEHAVVLPQR